MRAKIEEGMWQSFRQGPYYRPGVTSFIMHLTLLILLSVNWLWSPVKKMSANQPPVEIIQATAINEKTYESQVREIEQAQKRELQKIVEEKRKIEEVKKQEVAKQQAIVEEKRKAVEAAKQVEIEKQKATEALKQQQIADQKKAEAEKIKAAEAEKQKAEVAAQQKIEAQQKTEADAKRKVEEDAKKAAEEKQKAENAAKQQAEDKRKAEEERRRHEQLLAEQQALAAEQQSFVSSELSRFESLIQQKIASVWAVPMGADPSQQVRLLVRLAPDGTVLSATVTQSSGNSALDQSAVTAVLRASPLPVATDPAVFQEMRELDIILTPQSVL